MFEGSFVAIVTPFKDDESLDESKLKELIEFQIAEGTHGIVPCGTTGESPTLSHLEHDRVVALTTETVNGRALVIAGSGSNSTAEALRLTKHAKAVGADGALVITPYYNKPTQAWSIRPLHENRGRCRYPDYHLQRPFTHRHRHPPRNARQTCGSPKYCRHQRGNRTSQTFQRHCTHVRRGFYHPFRKR